MEFTASSGSILSLKSSCEENCELGGYLGNKVSYVLLNLPGTAQRFSPMDFIVAIRHLLSRVICCRFNASASFRKAHFAAK